MLPEVGRDPTSGRLEKDIAVSTNVAARIENCGNNVEANPTSHNTTLWSQKENKKPNIVGDLVSCCISFTRSYAAHVTLEPAYHDVHVSGLVILINL